MTFEEAAAIMIKGTGGQVFELPTQVDLEKIEDMPFNYVITETYAKTASHEEYKRKIGLKIYNYGGFSEYISEMYFYNNGVIPDNPYDYDDYISFSNFYIN